jgi:hypothetical protein
VICDLLGLFIRLLMQVAKYTTRCKNISHGCQSWLNLSFEVVIIVATPLKMAPFKTIYLNEISNDNINKKWGLPFMDNTMSTCQEIWRKGKDVQKQICLFTRNVEFDISSDGNKGIVNNIMRSYVFPSMGTL